jgi:hypothetical protein
VRKLLAQLSQDLSDSPLVTHAQNEFGIFHRIPVVRRDLVLGQFTLIGKPQEVIDGLLNCLFSTYYIR